MRAQIPGVDIPHVCLVGIDSAWGCVSTCPKEQVEAAAKNQFEVTDIQLHIDMINGYARDMALRVAKAQDHRLKTLLKEAFEAGEAHGDYIAGIGEGYQMEPQPEFNEWLAQKIASVTT